MAHKNEAAVELGRRGGKARAASQTVAERKESASRAAQARWAKQKMLVAEITEGTKELLKTSKANARRAKQKIPKPAQ
ncbi:MAG: hypothetical protein ABSD75_01795 [Terriglobales bacterium]